MLMIYDKFTELSEKELQSELIWTHLETMYNLEALDESESLPFPNNESDFELPDADFASLKENKIEEKKNIQKGRETPKMMKEVVKRDDKTPNRNTKEVQRRDSKDSKNSTPTNKKEVKKEPEKLQAKPVKGRTSSTSSSKDEPTKPPKNKNEESGRPGKRPTRGSIKPDEPNSGKASPVTVTQSSAVKRRRI